MRASHPSATVVALICLSAMVTGTIWPFVVSVLAPVLREELRFSATGLGTAYALYYLVASAASRRIGRLIDRWSVRTSMRILVVLSVGQLLLLSTARGWPQLTLSGLVAGIALASTNPVTNTAIATTVVPERAQWVVGVKQAGVPLAAALAGAILPTVTTVFGWRAAVLGVAGLPLATLALTHLLRAGAGHAHRYPPMHWQRPSPLELYALLLGVVAAGLNGYLALYVVDALGSSVERAGAVMAAFATAGIVGRVVWAALGDGPRTYRLLAILATVGATALAVLVAPASEWLVWAAALVCGLTVIAWQGLGMLAIVRTHRGSVGETSGRVLRMFYGGFVVGSPAVGAIIDRAGFAWMWAGLALIAAAAVFPLIPELREPSEP